MMKKFLCLMFAACLGPPSGNLVTQDSADGKMVRCWKLAATELRILETRLFWQENGNWFNLKGSYRMIEVHSDRWKEAAQSLEINLEDCKSIGDFK